LAIAAVFCAPLAFAADTNIISSLTIDGHTYTNVELGTVTASHVTIFYDGGGQKVAISNLPAYLQKRFNYDPDVARSEDAAEAQRKAAIRQRAEQSAKAVAIAKGTLGPAQTIRILKVSNEAQLQLQIVQTNGQPAEAYIHNLPYEVLTFVRDLNGTKATVEAEKYVQYNDRATGNGGAYATRQAQKAADERHLADLEGPYGNHAKACTTIIARPSAYLPYRNVRQWEYQGMASAEVP
jgi:hypothetical protein